MMKRFVFTSFYYLILIEGLKTINVNTFFRKAFESAINLKSFRKSWFYSINFTIQNNFANLRYKK